MSSGSKEVLAGSMFAVGMLGLVWIASFSLLNTRPTARASISSSPMPPMCMNMTLGESHRKWLCSAVTCSPLSRATLITGLTSFSSRTISPMTIVWSPARVNAAQAVRPRSGIIRAPATVASMSLRGKLTLNTPSFSFSAPLRPVNCSMRLVSGAGVSAMAAGTNQRAVHSNAARRSTCAAVMTLTSIGCRPPGGSLRCGV